MAALSVGVGSWNLRSTARRPRPHTALYREVLEDARLVEACGFDSLWLTEHRFWYDGWCPQPVLVAAAVLAATERLKVGTGIHLLPQHDPERAAHVAATVDSLFAGRLDLGVGLGYREEEFAALGLDVTQRGKRLTAGLDALRAAGYGGVIRLGGRSEITARRAVRTGSPILLQPGLKREQVEELLGVLDEVADGGERPGVGVMVDVWVEEDGDLARERFAAILRRHYEEYARAWWVPPVDGAPDEPRIAKQIDRAVATAVAGTPEEVAARLGELAGIGIDLLVLQAVTEEGREDAHRQLELQGRRLLPLLRKGAS